MNGFKFSTVLLHLRLWLTSVFVLPLTGATSLLCGERNVSFWTLLSVFVIIITSLFMSFTHTYNQAHSSWVLQPTTMCRSGFELSRVTAKSFGDFFYFVFCFVFCTCFFLLLLEDVQHLSKKYRFFFTSPTEENSPFKDEQESLPRTKGVE